MSKKARVAVYLGTFDPLTMGHFDVITRASSIFDLLIVGVGVNKAKNPCFSLDERLQMAKGVCDPLRNVKVFDFRGLACDFALSHNAKIMVRGLRTEADFVYEMQMAMMNQVLSESIETIFIPTRQSLSHISSSLVKEVASLGGNISTLVPPLVFEHLAEKYSIRL
ncbi:MAG: pantetheine-phosphate adenylyltransferase [Oligoflexales bacterium]